MDLLDIIMPMLLAGIGGGFVGAYLKPCFELRRTLSNLVGFLVTQMSYLRENGSEFSNVIREFRGEIEGKANQLPAPVHRVFSVVKLIPNREELDHLNEQLTFLARNLDSGEPGPGMKRVLDIRKILEILRYRGK